MYGIPEHIFCHGHEYQVADIKIFFIAICKCDDMIFGYFYTVCLLVDVALLMYISIAHLDEYVSVFVFSFRSFRLQVYRYLSFFKHRFAAFLVHIRCHLFGLVVRSLSFLKSGMLSYYAQLLCLALFEFFLYKCG